MEGIEQSKVAGYWGWPVTRLLGLLKSLEKAVDAKRWNSCHVVVRDRYSIWMSFASIFDTLNNIEYY